MKVLLLTHGTRGDVEPFAALGHALNRAGHQAVLVAPGSSAALAERAGLRFVPVFETWHELAKDPAIAATPESNHAGLRGKGRAVMSVRKYRRLIARVHETMAAAAMDEECDLVVYHPSGSIHQIGERLGVPTIPACIVPAWVPTNSFSNPLLPVRLPRTLRRTSYWATRARIRCFVGSTWTWRRDTLRLGRRHRYADPLRRPDGTPSTVLHAFSRHMLPHPLDYPEWVHTTGFWSLPLATGWSPPQGLVDFLAGGDPPICIGFGSIVGANPAPTRHLILDAIDRAGVRAVIIADRGGNPTPRMGPSVYRIEDAPFEWLLPRTAAVVHHGGIGTTGAAMAAGRPQVICPFIIEQRFCARRMHAVGVAPEPLLQTRLMPDQLASAIRLAVDDRAMAKQATRLGQRVRAEDGVQGAVKVLESLIETNHRTVRRDRSQEAG